MLPIKIKRGKEAYYRLKTFEGVPFKYMKLKRKIVPEALRMLRIKPGNQYCYMGRLSHLVGWKYQDVVSTLEVKRKQSGALFVKRAKKNTVSIPDISSSVHFFFPFYLQRDTSVHLYDISRLSGLLHGSRLVLGRILCHLPAPCTPRICFLHLFSNFLSNLFLHFLQYRLLIAGSCRMSRAGHNYFCRSLIIKTYVENALLR
ncbi:UNVERIFIED_CONTAM: hypothetical protein GTU68_004309 [Idotea baltica]|nr:hypothetical protein [Idotea baltica]